ncbi:alpha/beta-hydrolase [Cylindrobasidium torrendii FP15055 ss-10]|uniref:Alpha/beta-hydrolase n=1 Tax=Cylindrobasidium torrendii FP15055 ss-10 TaxID=1314674 RepID=A0A0D7BCD2_9AGAR|nr:alpha/beta-hydrolase [Cylindrobasidium torrendii FP15055 ss-10]
MRRTSIEAATRFFTDWLSYSEIQAACGRSITMYKLWTALERQPFAVDSIGEDACIAWLGPKPMDKPDKVILYFPGGGYINPPTTANMSFIHEMKRHAEERGASVSVAMLLYKLRPEGHFPTQVRDAKNGLDFILSLDVDPSNIQLVGDSAGGHLLLQFISHILHPLPPLMCDPIPSDIKFGGIFLVSPSVSLRGDVGRDGFERNDGVDALSPKIYRKWGSEYFYEVSEDFLPFGDAVHAPHGWFDGLENVAERVLLSAGEHECPTDAIEILWDKHLQKHPNSKFVVVKDGVHVDFVLDFVVKPFQVGEQTREVFDWVSDGFA